MTETRTVEEQSTCVTYRDSSCSSYFDNKTTPISIRLPLWLLQKLKEKGISNLSRYVKLLLIENIQGELSIEEKLDYELDSLKGEMAKLQDYNSTLLKHGSYAKDYYNKLKRGVSVTHRPFNFSKEQVPTLSQEELACVEETVNMREALNKQYREKLNQALKLKREKYGLPELSLTKTKHLTKKVETMTKTQDEDN